MSDHEHKPRPPVNVHSPHMNVCETCGEPIDFNGEWNYWWTLDQRNARWDAYDRWVESLKHGGA